ncbi:tetratricopeptide repeat protein [Aeoliella mucimassa]|uniref:Tetratricopeptide repeat protein n=1 Tax=Aeoliella mucimassa TaxID=2527972 RepID=A0A518AJ33_9BACT|nr:tetratricopeptide repeat protein [Aeoliella mucimassa]QDU54739.1 Tetratricopeptide repeat protein [Aeoliella mucimassa]
MAFSLGQPQLRLLCGALFASLLLIGQQASAQVTPESLIGDAVSDPDAARYSDIAEAIKRYENNDVLGAMNFLESAKSAEDRLPPANLMMAKMYFLTRQTAAGLQALERTASESPNDPEPYVLLADQAMTQSQAVQASALYDKAVELIKTYDKNPRRKRKLAIRAYAGRAAVLQRWQDWAAAEADLNAWIAEDPEAASAYNRLGLVLFMEGREKEGYDAFTKAKELNEKLPSPFVSAAAMYQRLANVPENSENKASYESKAKQSFERAYQADKNDETTLVSYSEWLIRSGDLAQAEKVLAAARTAQPTSHQIQLLSGVLAEMTGKPAEAEKFYNQTLALSPGNRDASNQLAQLLIKSDDEEVQARAEAVARLNARLNENNSDVNLTLAWVLRKRNKGAEANQAFTRGIRLGQPNADSTLLIAKLLVEQERKKDARAVLENALKNDQGIFVHRAEAEALLESLK